MKFRLLFAFVLLLVSINIAAADDNNPTPWPIVKRCLPTPIVPDKNWSYDGEILLNGWAGIHAIHDTSAMPYVVHWGWGILSPNGQWILTQKMHEEMEQLSGPGPMARYYLYYGDIVAENLKTGKKIVFTWEANVVFSSGPYLFGPAGPIWLDNNHFVSFYGGWGQETREGDIETGEIIDRPDLDLTDYEYSMSPDQTRAVYGGRFSNTQLYNLLDKEPISDNPVGGSRDLISSVWSPNSLIFVDVTTDENRKRTLTVFDRDGAVVATPFVVPESNISLGLFSPTNRYFSFEIPSGNGTTVPFTSRQLMLDLNEEVIYDLCIDNAQGIAWSPDGTQFATILGVGQQPIVVVDMNDWQPFIVGYHIGSVLLWRGLP
ncbi:MAG: hypothetical protein H0X30_04905 [Anaerolineae bacterium]|nr:hypothetical protein [Anaerolineae bacterium]